MTPMRLKIITLSVDGHRLKGHSAGRSALDCYIKPGSFGYEKEANVKGTVEFETRIHQAS
jgi:hypothetical protein